jgi:hypothetical protein
VEVRLFSAAQLQFVGAWQKTLLTKQNFVSVYSYENSERKR